MTLGRVVRALMAWHGVTVGDLAQTVHMAKSTLERRFGSGGWTAREVAALSWAFTAPIAVLYSGEIDLGATRWKGPERSGPAPLPRIARRQPTLPKVVPSRRLVSVPASPSRHVSVPGQRPLLQLITA